MLTLLAEELSSGPLEPQDSVPQLTGESGQTLSYLRSCGTLGHSLRVAEYKMHALAPPGPQMIRTQVASPTADS